MNREPPARSLARGRVDAPRLRQLRLARGLGTDALARRARISRTTLHHLEKGRIPFPRAGTLKKLAAALAVSVEELLQGAPSGTAAAAKHRRAFDRQTNPVVDEVLSQRPRLFDHWSEDDWDELYSEFGVGGPLTSGGVIHAALRINRKRETLRQLAIVLETHLAEVAAGIVEKLYSMVQSANPLPAAAEEPGRGGL